MSKSARSMRSPDAERLMDIAFQFQSLLMEGKVKMVKEQREKLADEIQGLSHSLGFQFRGQEPLLEVELRVYEAEALLDATKELPKELDPCLLDALKKIRRAIPRRQIERQIHENKQAYLNLLKQAAESRRKEAVEQLSQ